MVILAAGVVLACTGLAAPAQAEAATDDQAETIILSWQETPGEVIGLESELLGHLTVVPGAHVERVLLVQNAGPSEATLTVSVVNASATYDGAGWVEDPFYDDLLVMGLPSAQLDGQETVVLSVEVAQGASVPVTLDVEFPSEATSGNTAEVGEREFTFDVRLTLSGPGAVTSDDGQDDGGKGYLTGTGGTLTNAAWGPLVLAAALLAGAWFFARQRSLAVARSRAPLPGRRPEEGSSEGS